ncbi:hypothetical protein IE077_002781 [Cardiosporidium cionae]|uniref:Uncharacterized protein n=1 Tax=Cardiosporidium cionae TaxID=476202 RepID=A0ABQ7JA08_9APIC|nr:hypothetical protein IE077_002781 [Cardiosporidium cionae]|eukprot:KAF8820812.1 hypothetical protein IE077_002781 [Cardiosporidium cionae]
MKMKRMKRNCQPHVYEKIHIPIFVNYIKQRKKKKLYFKKNYESIKPNMPIITMLWWSVLLRKSQSKFMMNWMAWKRNFV